MSDDFNQLENQLRQLRPRELSRDFHQRLELEQAAPRTSLADRCLAFAMSCGAIAASLIIGMLIYSVAASSGPAISVSPPSVAASATIRDYERFLARSNDVLPENFR